jgi:hypothetical protein
MRPRQRDHVCKKDLFFGSHWADNKNRPSIVGLNNPNTIVPFVNYDNHEKFMANSTRADNAAGVRRQFQ